MCSTSCSSALLFLVSQVFWNAIILFSMVSFLSSSSSSFSFFSSSSALTPFSSWLVWTPQDAVSSLCFKSEGRWCNRPSNKPKRERGGGRDEYTCKYMYINSKISYCSSPDPSHRPTGAAELLSIHILYELFINHKPVTSPDWSVPGHDKHHQMSTAESNKNNKNK